MKWADYKAARNAEKGVTEPAKSRMGPVPQHGKGTIARSGCPCDLCEAFREAFRERKRERERLGREANLERARENERQYRKANRERTRENSRRWYAANPERQRESSRQWREANPERHRENCRRWQEANPERVRENIRRREARKAGVPHEPYTLAEIAERDEYMCQLCKRPVDMSLSGREPMGPQLDHVHPISKGGPDVPANIQLTHGRCNLIKGDRLDIDPSRYLTDELATARA